MEKTDNFLRQKRIIPTISLRLYTESFKTEVPNLSCVQKRRYRIITVETVNIELTARTKAVLRLKPIYTDDVFQTFNHFCSFLSTKSNQTQTQLPTMSITSASAGNLFLV